MDESYLQLIPHGGDPLKMISLYSHCRRGSAESWQPLASLGCVLNLGEVRRAGSAPLPDVLFITGGLVQLLSFVPRVSGEGLARIYILVLPWRHVWHLLDPWGLYIAAVVLAKSSGDPWILLGSDH